MSVTDPVILMFDEEHEYPFSLIRGRETFYDADTNEHMRWLDPRDAIEYARESLGVEAVVNEGLVVRIEDLIGMYDDKVYENKDLEKQVRKLKKEMKERPTQTMMFDGDDEDD